MEFAATVMRADGRIAKCALDLEGLRSVPPYNTGMTMLNGGLGRPLATLKCNARESKGFLTLPAKSAHSSAGQDHIFTSPSLS